MKTLFPPLRIRTHYNGLGTPKLEKFEKPSLTVPDQTLTLRQILNKHTVGGYGQEPVFNGDVYIPNPKSLDQIDLQEMRENLTNQFDEIKQASETQNKALAKRNAELIKKGLEAENKPPAGGEQLTIPD